MVLSYSSLCEGKFVQSLLQICTIRRGIWRENFLDSFSRTSLTYPVLATPLKEFLRTGKIFLMFPKNQTEMLGQQRFIMVVKHKNKMAWLPNDGN